MDILTIYDVIAVAYKSRLLFRTDAEYRNALGVSFETVANNRESKRDMTVYYDILNRECESSIEQSLSEVVTDYILASEYFLLTDWGDRTHMASRKKFCRMLFRFYATAGLELTADEILKFKIKNDDKRLLEIFFPNGTDEAPAVEIGYILMFAFGVMKPWSGIDGARSRDISSKDLQKMLVGLRDLLTILSEDIPRLGSTEKPVIFYEWLEMIDARLSDKEALSEITHLWLLMSIFDVTNACRSLAITGQTRVITERLQGYDIPGIWIDDADEGRTRFWIFPDNFLVAFCYSHNETGWEMTPYEFRVRFATDDSYYDTFIILDPDGNLGYTLSPDNVLRNNQFGYGSCDCEFDETTGEMVKVELHEEFCKFPDWLNWRNWIRLEQNGPMYEKFHTVLCDIYNPNSPHSLFFKNIVPELTDIVNNLVGRDNKYIYIYDWRPERFAIIENSHDRFTYNSKSCQSERNCALFELPVSEEHPLYALPLHIKKENYRNEEAKLLAELLEDADNITELYILHSNRVNHPRLVFSNHSRTVALDMEVLEALGVKKFTTNPSNQA